MVVERHEANRAGRSCAHWTSTRRRLVTAARRQHGSTATTKGDAGAVSAPNTRRLTCGSKPPVIRNVSAAACEYSKPSPVPDRRTPDARLRRRTRGGLARQASAGHRNEIYRRQRRHARVRATCRVGGLSRCRPGAVPPHRSRVRSGRERGTDTQRGAPLREATQPQTLIAARRGKITGGTKTAVRRRASDWGFCFGGPRVPVGDSRPRSTAVSFYGGQIDGGPRFIDAFADEPRAPVFFAFGGKDQFITAEMIGGDRQGSARLGLANGKSIELRSTKMKTTASSGTSPTGNAGSARASGPAFGGYRNDRIPTLTSRGCAFRGGGRVWARPKFAVK